MAKRIYLPTDSLQLYIDKETVDEPFQYTASHCRIIPNYDAGVISIIDKLKGERIVNNIPFADIQNEAGTQAGATIVDVVLYLSKIIG